MKKYISLIIVCLICLVIQATNNEHHWKTHFAYNSVQQIALDDNQVYALANGKLFSIDQTTEKITLYNNFSGFHGTEITQLTYDSIRDQLLLMYTDGKMDIWHPNQSMRYIPDLYNKQMTASKKCNNITIADNIAYLAMDFGILTFDLENYEIVDTYYIGDEASEIKVLDVLIVDDSIYAKSNEKVYAAHLEDNIVDYRYWETRTTSSPRFDTKKGHEYKSKNGDIWRVAGNKGVERTFITNEIAYYLPDGPEVNTPYAIVCREGMLWMVAGGRWINQNREPGHVMWYKGGKWTNINQSMIGTQTQKEVLDFTAIAVDPNNASHYFVSSFGTGLYEFMNEKLVANYKPHNSILGSAAPNSPDRYTRVESPVYDNDGRLWVAVAGGVDTSLVAFLPDGTQRGLNLYPDENNRFVLNTPGAILVDRENTHRKWMVSCRSEAAIVLLDDGGSHFDSSDDQCVVRKEFLDQDGGIIAPEFFYTIAQAPNGDIWIGSSNGPIIIPQDVDFLNSNQCKRLRIQMADETYLMENERVNAFAWDNLGQVWIGTQTGGVYVLDRNCEEIIACYTNTNSALPSNSILSLAWNEVHSQMFIGTSGGLVSYLLDPNIFSSVEETSSNDYESNHGNMFRWRAHNAFTNVNTIACMSDKVYGLSANSLFSVDKPTDMVKSHTKLDGLSASNITHIAHNPLLNRLLIVYQNGQIDIMTSEEEIYNISDLFLKQMNASKEVNDICIYGDKAYLAMTFGILVINMRKLEIEETYYIGYGSSEVNVEYISIVNDEIYALSSGTLYYAHVKDNLMDYAYWKTRSVPLGKSLYGMRSHENILYLVVDKTLYAWKNHAWKNMNTSGITALIETSEELFVVPENRNGLGKIEKDGSINWMFTDATYCAIAQDNDTYWLGSYNGGLIQYDIVNQSQRTFSPDGPANNSSYRICFFDDKLYMLPGGRWANEFKRKGDVMIFENEEWHNIKNADLLKITSGHKVFDLMNVAQDPRDAKHYWVTSFGTGLYEFYGDSIISLYLPENSNLMSAAPAAPKTYTRTDGAIYDDSGNLWVLNLGGGDTKNIHVITPQGKWHSFNAYYQGKTIEMHTTGEILIDQRNPEWKWIPILRYNTGLVLLEDNGTPTRPEDDVATYRTEWVDQNGNYIIPTTIHSIAQDHDNVLWVGTGSGIFIIPASVDFRTSNRCRRIIIPRNDGTSLGDYLLDNEQINAIQIDGANRIWVGTANSGVFLFKPTSDNVEDPGYYVETISHFTTENSILPSNEILDIAIQESTGEVFFATGSGLVSYMSDATPSAENLNEIYAYPNPVLPSYKGYITFKGLVSNTELRIVDPSGNLVKTITSEGGTAVWDVTNSRGERVSSGVYTALCNTLDGKYNGFIKVMIIN
jgi:ligand-binding sensor domain-containing protein